MYVGQPLPRPEDFRFLTGRGHYVDDVKVGGTSYAAFLRSPHAHAKILRIDTSAASRMPGVLRIVTGEDWAKAKLGKLVCVHPMPFTDGRPMREVLRPVLATGEVNHVGDVVAAVVAETRYQALDALEAIEVDYEPLPAIAKTGEALSAAAPLVHEHLGTNQINEIIRGDKPQLLMLSRPLRTKSR
jgi:carbon-monoxide dehydrogenase large subunit